MKPQWQVKQHGDLWWDIPPPISDAIEETRRNGCDAVTFTYDWGWQRSSNFKDPITGELTTISRYQIDFRTKKQKNLDTGFEREVRLVYREEQE